MSDFFCNFNIRNNLNIKIMSNRTGDTFLALLVGAAVGVGVGILFASDKGSNIRKKIKEAIDESGVLNKYNEFISSIQNEVSESKASFEENLEDLLSEGSYKTEELIVLLEQKLQALKEENAKFKK